MADDFSPEALLWQCCVNNDVTRAASLISSPGIDLSWVGPERGDACFNRACRLGRLEIVEEFLRTASQAVLNQTNEGGGTGFSLACQEGHVALVRRLLRDPRIDFNLPTKKNATPFLIACQNAHTEIVGMLLTDPRIDVIQSNLNRATPFFKACANGNLEVVQLLLDNPRIELNVPDTEGCSPLWFAAHEGFLEVIQRIVASGRFIDTQLRSHPQNDAWGDLTASGIARLSFGRLRYFNETEEEYQRARQNSLPIANLLDDFDRDPDRVKWEVRTKRDIRDPFIAETYALLILLADDYLAMKPALYPPSGSGNQEFRRVTRAMSAHQRDSLHEDRIRRFLTMALALPLDLKMVLCNRLYTSPKDVILKKFSEPAFAKVFRELGA